MAYNCRHYTLEGVGAKGEIRTHDSGVLKPAPNAGAFTSRLLSHKRILGDKPRLDHAYPSMRRYPRFGGFRVTVFLFNDAQQRRTVLLTDSHAYLVSQLTLLTFLSPSQHLGYWCQNLVSIQAFHPYEGQMDASSFGIYSRCYSVTLTFLQRFLGYCRSSLGLATKMPALIRFSRWRYWVPVSSPRNLLLVLGVWMRIRRLELGNLSL